MKQKNILQLIPKAIDIASKKLSEDGISISSQYNGYISAFGASVTQTGLIPTVAFYSAKDSSSEKDRLLMLDSIVGLLKDAKPNESLLDYVLRCGNDSKRDVLTAAIALKLSIRTFKKIQKDE